MSTNQDTQDEESTRNPEESIGAALFEKLDDLYSEVRYQCFHHCRWEDEGGRVVRPFDCGRGHLPEEGDRPTDHEGPCGFEAIGKRLMDLRGSSSNTELTVGSPPDSAWPVVIDTEYAAFLTKSRIIGKQEGYAIALHGSMTRDFDLVAIPWAEDCRKPINLVTRLCFSTGWKMQDESPTPREHGRLVWSLIREEFGDPRFIDFSVMPSIPPQNERTLATKPAPKDSDSK